MLIEEKNFHYHRLSFEKVILNLIFQFVFIQHLLQYRVIKLEALICVIMSSVFKITLANLFLAFFKCPLNM